MGTYPGLVRGPALRFLCPPHCTRFIEAESQDTGKTALPPPPHLSGARQRSPCMQALSDDRRWGESRRELADSLWYCGTLSGVPQSLFGAGPHGHPPPRISLVSSTSILRAGSVRRGIQGGSRRELADSLWYWVLSREYTVARLSGSSRASATPHLPCAPQ